MLFTKLSSSNKDLRHYSLFAKHNYVTSQNGKDE